MIFFYHSYISHSHLRVGVIVIRNNQLLQHCTYYVKLKHFPKRSKVLLVKGTINFYSTAPLHALLATTKIPLESIGDRYNTLLNTKHMTAHIVHILFNIHGCL